MLQTQCIPFRSKITIFWHCDSFNKHSLNWEVFFHSKNKNKKWMQFLILSSFSGRKKIVLWYFCHKIKSACCCIQRLTVESFCNYIRSAFGILCDSDCVNEIRFKTKVFSKLSVEMTIDTNIPYPNKQHQREIHISIGPYRIPLTSYICTYNFGIICTSRVAISLVKCLLFMAVYSVHGNFV